MAKPKPLKVHAVAFLASLVPIGFGLGFSRAMPFVSVECTRSGEQVDCVMQRKLLGWIPFETTQIHDLKSVRFVVVQGKRDSAHLETTDAGHLILTDVTGRETNVLLESGREVSMERSKAFAAELEAFPASGQPAFSKQTAPLLGYAAFVPVAVGLVFFGMVSWNFLETRWKSLRT